MLLDFIDELRKNYLSVAWNNGLDTVVFVNKSVDGYKSLDQMIEEHLHDKDQASDISF
jgi:hypothetical protein